MAIALWIIMLVLLACGWFLRSISRRSSVVGRRRKNLLIVGYVVWAAIVMVFMLWIGASRMGVVGPLFVPVIIVLSFAGAFSDDIGRLVRRVKASKRGD